MQLPGSSFQRPRGAIQCSPSSQRFKGFSVSSHSCFSRSCVPWMKVDVTSAEVLPGKT